MEPMLPKLSTFITLTSKKALMKKRDKLKEEPSPLMKVDK